MFTHMDADHSRFRKIIRGQIKQNLKKYIGGEDLIAQIKDLPTSPGSSQKITIPLPHITLPRFTHAPSQQQESAGVGQGKGDVGDILNPTKQDENEEAGHHHGQHSIQDEVSLDELADMLTETLELPRIKKKGALRLKHDQNRYSSITSQGPHSLHHVKRTYKSALKRSITTGVYDPEDPIIVPIRDDHRYRSRRAEPQPDYSAVIIYMMDVSGSMGEAQKELVRLTSFWIDTWLTREYKGIEKRYIIHDAVAKTVSKHEFYHTKENGGTLISSAYHQALRLIDEEFCPSQWNIYLFHFSDGDNWSEKDTRTCCEILEQSLLPAANLFCYGQTTSRYGSGNFLLKLQKHFDPLPDSLITQTISNKEAITDTIKAFLGTGK